jgi:hypothetical protein
MEEVTDITDQLEMEEEEDETGIDLIKAELLLDHQDEDASGGGVDSDDEEGVEGDTLPPSAFMTMQYDNHDDEPKNSNTTTADYDDNEDEYDSDDEPPPLMIVPEVSLSADEDKDNFFSQEVEITEECVELIKDKMSSFDYKCALCEFSTSYVSGNIYYIRSRNGNIYYPCEMCQFVKITLQTATQTYMSKVTKKVNRDGSETMLTVPAAPGDQNRIDIINNSRKAATEFVAKYHVGLNNSAKKKGGSNTTNVHNFSSSKSGGAGQRSPSQSSVTSPWGVQPHVDVNIRSGVEKKYSCDFCPYNTTTFYRLQQHVQKDHNIERHVCPQVKCSFEAADEASLKEHVMNIHEGSRFPCHLCSFLATRKATLKTHIESIHEGVKYPCEQCGYAATQMSALRRHIRSQHGVDGKDARNNRRPYTFVHNK